MRYVTGPVTLTRMEPVSYGSNRMRRVGSDHVEGCSKSHGSALLGSASFQISRVESGRVKSFSKLAGRLKLGQEVHKITRVRSGQVEADQNFAGRVGSTVFQNSRVGSCRVKRFSKSRGSGRVGWGRQVTRPDPIRLVRYDLTHEKPGVYRYSCSVFRIIFNCH